jgi:prolipoprotein diacylglyceryl transferase
MQHRPLAYIPSPSHGVYHLFGFIPIRGYAIMIIIGVVVAVWLGERRWKARGGRAGSVVDAAVWAVPFGLVGARLYNVITDYELYFGKGRDPINAFKVWDGGLGIWGGVALGALGTYIYCRRHGIYLRSFADAVAPGIALAQGIGRWGNWFNQELYGWPSKLPWAVQISPAHRVAYPNIGTYQPTFLYECLWDIGVALLVIWAERRFRLTYGRAFALYVAAYTVGRAWVEDMRIDFAHHILGLRLNDWTSIAVFAAAVIYLYAARRHHVVDLGPGARAVPDSPEADGAIRSPETTADEPGEPGEPGEPDETGESTDPPEADDPAAAAEANETAT